ncbi:MAG: hypothetical protein ACE5Q6_19035 [Dehalococcoidia bacterium]
MNEAVAAAIITATFLLLTSATFLFLLDVWTDQSKVAAESVRRQAEQLDTSISITSTADDVDELNCGLFTVQVQNTGAVEVADFTEVDFLAKYTDDSGNQVTPYLDYTTDWSVSSISPDDRDPNVWSPQETATFSFTLNPVMQLDSYANLVIVTAQGIRDLAYFTCAQSLYLHSETQDISGTDYYLMRGTAADGTAATISVTGTAGQTGRLSPAPNSGKFVIPLTGTATLQASTWEVNYRVKRDKDDFGFVWFTNATDISLTTTGSWQDIDLSGSLPSGATGAIVEVVNTGTSSDYSGVVRGKEDTRDYMSNILFEEIQAETHRWQIVKVDSNRFIQGYIENAEIDFKLLGYTLGSDPSYFAVPPEITLGTTGSWTTADVSSHVDADADGVILFIDSISSVDEDYGVREAGSSFSTTSLELEEFGNTMYLVGIDASDQFEVYAGSIDVKIYLVAQTKGSVVYYTDDTAVSDPTTGSWQELDADDNSVSADANGLIFRAENTSSSTDQRISLRHGDSTDDWNGNLSQGTHLQAAVGINSANVWDEFMEGGGPANADLAVDIAGYTRLVRLDVHADIDVLVRQADGTVRTTISSEVGDSSNITSESWQSVTGTVVFPGYTVVDQTDYLEIDLFADFATNSSEEEVTVDFRIDDSSLAEADQTKIDF